MKKKTHITQLNLFDDIRQSQEIQTSEIIKFSNASQDRSLNLNGAITRMMRARQYHEVAVRLSQEVLHLRIENDKLKNEVMLLKRAN
jgi:hypothetical protein